MSIESVEKKPEIRGEILQSVMIAAIQSQGTPTKPKYKTRNDSMNQWKGMAKKCAKVSQPSHTSMVAL